MTKTELSLNPDYYSAHAYVLEEEEEESTSIKTVLKLLMTTLIIGALILGYTYFIKDNLRTIGLWLSEVKQVVFPEARKKKIRIREEPSIINKELIVPTITIDKVPRLTEVKKIKKEVKKVLKSKPLDNNTLTDDYIKLMEQSLVKY